MPVNTSTSQAILEYVSDTAPVLMLQLNEQLCITEANALAQSVLPVGAIGKPMIDSIVNFSGKINLQTLVTQQHKVHMLTVSTQQGLPETFYFRFFLLDNMTLALASVDFNEERQMRNQVLALNSDLNNLTRELYQANTELRSLNELKNQFLGMAAHDLRKPVGIIMTYMEFVIDEAQQALSGEHLGFLQSSLKAATSMKLQIDNFLDVSVIESGKLRLAFEPLTANEILASAKQIGEMLAQRKNVDLRILPADNQQKLLVDGGKLQQVLLNLTGNAIEHSSEGLHVSLSAHIDKTEVTFMVEDQGSGISVENQRNLFSSFAEIGTRKTGNERSTGLGLTIARIIVEAHGGSIDIDSKPGQGCKFFFKIPLKLQNANLAHQ